MKHVREDLPDVQMRRPEVSAALAAVLDRATAKELDRRYPDAQAMIADLEDVLATESSRTGHVTGEATTVLRQPARVRAQACAAARAQLAQGGARHPARARARRPRRCSATSARAPSAGPASARTSPRRRAGLTSVPLGQRAAADFDPIGGDGEHPRETSALVDGDPSTTWSTETYDGGQLGKEGVGVIIDASPGGGVAAQRMTIRTPTPGFEASIWVADEGRPKTAPPDGLDARQLGVRRRRRRASRSASTPPATATAATSSGSRSCRRRRTRSRSPRSCCTSDRHRARRARRRAAARRARRSMSTPATTAPTDRTPRRSTARCRPGPAATARPATRPAPRPTTAG